MQSKFTETLVKMTINWSKWIILPTNSIRIIQVSQSRFHKQYKYCCTTGTFRHTGKLTSLQATTMLPHFMQGSDNSNYSNNVIVWLVADAA